MEGKLLVGVLAFLLSSLAQVSGESGTYVGAVVEYSPVIGPSEEVTAEVNVEEYKKFMKKAAEKGADIIVFPENGLGIRRLASRIPHPAQKIAPGDGGSYNTTEIVRELSRGSQKYNIYSVVNLVEERACEEGDGNCPEAGRYVFNTNVVFDRNGVVVARYAKYNLYEEHAMNKPPRVEISIFDTDFGVRFGTFTCFDILFATPALQLVRQYKITDFVFTTHWFSELPFLTAVQAQRGWAEANDANLLASGVSDPRRGSGGSGIYNGRFGALVEVLPGTETRKLLVATVPKKSSDDGRGIGAVQPFSVAEATPASDGDDHLSLFGDQMHLFATEVVPTGKVFERSVCSLNGFCCRFRVNVRETRVGAGNYTYRAAVYNGPRFYGREVAAGVQVCGVILCDGPLVANCTRRARDIPGRFTFEEIEIRGDDFRAGNAFRMPSTLADGRTLLPLSSNKYLFLENASERKAGASLELLWPVADLHTFAIYGRDFVRDGESPPPAAGAPLRSFPALLAAGLACYLFC